MNPGSPAPQASVLIQTSGKSEEDTGIQTRLRARTKGRFQKEISLLPQHTEADIISTLIQLKANGYEPNTITTVDWKLKQLARHTNLNDPKTVKNYIANATYEGKTQEVSNDMKNKFAYAYDLYCKAHGLTWERPWYNVKETVPNIPSKENVEAILNTATLNYQAIFTLLAETGAEGHELELCRKEDIDLEQGKIIIHGNKGHASGTYKLKTRTLEMLRTYLAKRMQTHETPFPTSEQMGDSWRKTRRRAMTKIFKPELDQIELKSLRNYSGAQFYYTFHDPIGTMQHLRHKKLETTMHYLRKITINNNEEEWICKTANTAQEATTLIEEGFTKADEIDGIHLYRKRK